MNPTPAKHTKPEIVRKAGANEFVLSKMKPIKYAPLNPLRLPIELIIPIAAAAPTPLNMRAGTDQKTLIAEYTPAAMTVNPNRMAIGRLSAKAKPIATAATIAATPT